MRGVNTIVVVVSLEWVILATSTALNPGLSVKDPKIKVSPVITLLIYFALDPVNSNFLSLGASSQGALYR